MIFIHPNTALTNWDTFWNLMKPYALVIAPPTVQQDAAVVDPGFARGGGDANSPGGPTYNFAKISQKLHEI